MLLNICWAVSSEISLTGLGEKFLLKSFSRFAPGYTGDTSEIGLWGGNSSWSLLKQFIALMTRGGEILLKFHGEVLCFSVVSIRVWAVETVRGSSEILQRYFAKRYILRRFKGGIFASTSRDNTGDVAWAPVISLKHVFWILSRAFMWEYAELPYS